MHRTTQKNELDKPSMEFLYEYNIDIISENQRDTAKNEPKLDSVIDSKNLNSKHRLFVDRQPSSTNDSNNTSRKIVSNQNGLTSNSSVIQKIADPPSSSPNDGGKFENKATSLRKREVVLSKISCYIVFVFLFCHSVRIVPNIYEMVTTYTQVCYVVC